MHHLLGGWSERGGAHRAQTKQVMVESKLTTYLDQHLSDTAFRIRSCTKKTTLMSMTADKIPKLSKLSVSCLVRTSGLDLSKTCAIQLKTLKPFLSNDLHSMTVLLSLEGDKLK